MDSKERGCVYLCLGPCVCASCCAVLLHKARSFGGGVGGGARPRRGSRQLGLQLCVRERERECVRVSW